MASRVIEAGTVISRTRFLLSTGVLKERPLWVDIAEAFPPIDQLPPRHKAKHLYYGRAKKLSYTEDYLRSYFYKHYSVVTKANPTVTEEVFSLYEGKGNKSILDLIDNFVRKQIEEISLGKSNTEASKSAVAAINGTHPTLQVEKKKVVEKLEQDTTTPLEKVVFSVLDSLNRH